MTSLETTRRFDARMQTIATLVAGFIGVVILAVVLAVLSAPRLLREAGSQAGQLAGKASLILASIADDWSAPVSCRETRILLAR